MAVQDINHINIYTHQPLLDEVRDFYVNVIGLTEGPRPNFPFPGYWLYAQGKPILHLMEKTDAEPAADIGVSHLDHIALTCEGLDETLEHLETIKAEFVRREIPEFNMVQLFIKDPSGLGVELNFRV